MNNLINPTAIITSFLLLFFATFLLFHKKGNVLSKKLLAFFLLVNAVFMIDYLVGIHLASDYFSNYYYLFYFGEMAAFLFGPSLYLYSCSVAYSNFKLNKSDYFHLVPAILFAIYFLTCFVFFNDQIETRIELTGGAFTPAERITRTLFFNLQVFSYLIFSLILLKKVQSRDKKILFFYRENESLLVGNNSIRFHPYVDYRSCNVVGFLV